MKFLPSFVRFLTVLSNHAKKNAPNQADNNSMFQLCLLMKMRLSVYLEGRYIGYYCPTIYTVHLMLQLWNMPRRLALEAKFETLLHDLSFLGAIQLFPAKNLP